MEGLEIPTLVGEEGVLRAGLVGGVDNARVLGKDGVNETETELDEEGTRAGEGKDIFMEDDIPGDKYAASVRVVAFIALMTCVVS
jgi:hypothetical protein